MKIELDQEPVLNTYRITLNVAGLGYEDAVGLVGHIVAFLDEIGHKSDFNPNKKNKKD